MIDNYWAMEWIHLINFYNIFPNKPSITAFTIIYGLYNAISENKVNPIENGRLISQQKYYNRSKMYTLTNYRKLPGWIKLVWKEIPDTFRVHIPKQSDTRISSEVRYLFTYAILSNQAFFYNREWNWNLHL